VTEVIDHDFASVRENSRSSSGRDIYVRNRTRFSHQVVESRVGTRLADGARMIKSAVVASLLCAAPAAADPHTTSYRSQTLAADGIGLGLLVAGGFAEGEGGRDTRASNTLFTVGILGTLFVTPAIHFARGHRRRAAGSVALRWGMAGGGMLLAMMGNLGCHANQPANDDSLFGDDFLCELDYIGYGMFGGLIAASVIDAAFMTDERVERPRWTPQLGATRDGVRVGATWIW
jgi:hypothetical protein